MSTQNERNETSTASSPILNRSTGVKQDNNLDDFPSDSGPLRAHETASFGGESSTNPTTSRPALVDNAASHARNAQQILFGIRDRVLPPLYDLRDTRVQRGEPMLLRLYGERAYVLTETEWTALFNRVDAIAAESGTVKAGARKATSEFAAQLAEMERTNRELAATAGDFRAAESMIGALEAQR